MATVDMSADMQRLLDALADVERAERRLAVEVAAFHATYDKLHPDDVPNWLRAIMYSAHAVLQRAKR